MDKLTLIDKGMEFMCNFAAPSVTTGRFVADILDSDKYTIIEAFTNPGEMVVHNVEGLYADKAYSGYSGIHSLRENGSITVVVDKEKP